MFCLKEHDARKAKNVSSVFLFFIKIDELAQ